MGVTLYYFAPSPPARTALLTVRALGLDVEIKEINLFKKDQLNPDFIKINPQHTLPTIDDDGFVLWESRAIASYLVRQYGKDDSLYPKNPQLKAVVDQRLYFDCGTLWPRLRAITFPAIFLGERKVSQEKKDSVQEAIGYMEKFLHGRKWLAGDSYTIADLSAFATLSSGVAIGIKVTDFPNVRQWLERCKELPGYDENEAGVKAFSEIVLSKLDSGEL